MNFITPFKFAPVALSLLLLSSVISQAGVQPAAELYGAVSGGGGKGLICTDRTTGAGSTVELLDLWEGRTLFGEEPKPQTLPLDEAVDAAFIRLKDAFPFQGGGYAEDGQNREGQEYVLDMLRREAKHFLLADVKTLRLRNVVLTSTEDSFEAARPNGCEVRNVVNYQPSGRVLIDQDLLERMDLTNQTALIVHEAFYSVLRELNTERSSIRVRRTVNYVMSGKTFALRTPEEPANFVECSSQSPTVPKTIWNLFKVASTKKNQTTFVFDPQMIEGSSLIGLTGDFHMETYKGTLERMLESNGCPGRGQQAIIKFALNGPVESDRVTTFHLICQNNKLKALVQNTSADHDSEPVMLDCKKNHVGNTKK